jgi:L-threonylcarbamoyladenylate synthase
VELLRQGGVVGLPTETVYGLAGNAFDPMAIARIFEAKGRPLTDPLIVHLPEASWIERVVQFYTLEQRVIVEKLAKAFWPGPMTLLLPRRPELPDLVTAGSEFVAVRVTAHPLFQEVLRGIGSPIAAPSANRFGRISPTSARDVQLELCESIDLILDGGCCEHGLESTIVALREGKLEILRPGPITSDQLREYGHVFTPNGIVNTPGSLPGHYAPKKGLHIIESDIHEFLPRANSGYLAFTTPSTEIQERFSQVEVLSPLGDLREAAANFYGALRKLDNSKADIIYAMRLPEEGIGLAIMDRLKRASFGSQHSFQSH